MSKLRLGIVGTGGICNNKHLPSLAKVADKVEVVALCDLIEEKARETAKRHGLTDVKIYTDYKEMLADESIDIIHVCTPNVAHCQVTVDAFEAGKHVLCEKPMAATTADAQKMIEAWKKSGKKFTVGYQNRYRPDVQVLKKSCEAGELGEIYYAEANAIRRKAVPTWGVFPDKSQQGGGPLIDIGTHALDITLWCMNNYEVDSVSGQVFYKLGNLPEAAQGRHLYVVIHCTSEDYRVHPIMFERLGKEFSEVIIQMAHMGEVMAGEYAIDVAKRVPNVYLDTAITSFMAVVHVLEQCPDKVFMGCDYPFYRFEMEIQKQKLAAEELHDEEGMRKLMGGNFARVFGLE